MPKLTRPQNRQKIPKMKVYSIRLKISLQLGQNQPDHKTVKKCR